MGAMVLYGIDRRGVCGLDWDDMDCLKAGLLLRDQLGETNWSPELVEAKIHK